MFKRSVFYFSIVIFHSFLFHGILQAQTSTPTPENNSSNTETTLDKNTNDELEKQKKPEDLIHFGDLIDVDVVGSTEFDWRGKLTPEGFLSGINFVDEPVYALCKSEDEVGAALSKGFNKFLNNPQINVRIIDRSGRPISQIFGAIKTPQRFQIHRPVNLNEIIILSGGITENSSGEIQILRPPNLSCQTSINKQGVKENSATETNEKYIPVKQETESKYIKVKISDLLKGKPDANPLIFPGDVITVSEAEPIYVMGGVVNPKQINSNTRLTLTRAIDSAGGFAKDAETGKILVFRHENNEVKTIEVDFEKTKLSAENDFYLKPRDIVEVPQKGREKSRFPPVIKNDDSDSVKNLQPPLKIID